jgi:hypothetical protein
MAQKMKIYHSTKLGVLQNRIEAEADADAEKEQARKSGSDIHLPYHINQPKPILYPAQSQQHRLIRPQDPR